MLDKFVDYITVEKRYSPHTITSYSKDLEAFLSFLQNSSNPQVQLMYATKKNVRDYIVHLNKNELSKRSINRKLSSLRSFYLYLLRLGEIKTSPMEAISSLKFYAEKQTPFSVEEMAQLKDEVEDKGKMPFLEQMIIETLYQTGMRKSELCNLLIENVDFSTSELKVIGKGNKQRIIPISEELALQLQQYLNIRKPLEEYNMYFFINNKGKKLGERFVYSVVNNYLSIVTTKEKRSPHILRHSFATHVLNGGAEISKVKKILGHSSLASTQVYTEANIEQLKKVFNQSHPRAKKDTDLE